MRCIAETAEHVSDLRPRRALVPFVIGDIRSCAEMCAVAPDHYRAHNVFVDETIDRGRDFTGHLIVDRISALWFVEADRADVAIGGDNDTLIHLYCVHRPPQSAASILMLR